MAKLIEIRDLSKVYERGKQKVEVLHHIDLDVEQGDFLALMGPSGSGKTTLLNLVGALDSSDSGDVIVGGEDLARLDRGELSDWRAANVGFVFQGFNLIPVLSALENVSLPLALTSLSRKQRRERAAYALELVGLSDRMHHRPRQLSGGQEQRCAIARAVVTDPAFILADEPTGDLDRDSAEQVLELLRRLNKDLGKTILMVTHDPHAAESAERIVQLDKGRLLGVTDRAGAHA